MKIINKIIFLLMVVLLPIGFTGCNDDDDDGMSNPDDNAPEFVLGQESLRVKIGSENKATVDVKQGGGEYNAFILDSRIAKAEIVDGVIKVEGLANGQTSLVVSDKYSRYRKLPVTSFTTDVLELSSKEIELVAILGNSKTIKANIVSGNGGYSITTDNKAVSVSVNEAGEITLKATSKKTEFSANVTVTDCIGLSATLIVKVIASMEAFSDDDLKAISADATRRYFFDGYETSSTYYTFLNETTEDGKQRYGWDYSGYFMLYIDFLGGKSVGVKSEAKFTYVPNGFADPISLEIIKNDGKNIWGIFTFVKEGAEKLYSGYFCDTVTNE